ncbi:hypothetical protein [Providencia manganoxydans]|uniref:hypothetical protein n=1 Tax=Providencia manganoxydans TaxID=2923283 RepID=UPI0034E51C8E
MLRIVALIIVFYGTMAYAQTWEVLNRSSAVNNNNMYVSGNRSNNWKEGDPFQCSSDGVNYNNSCQWLAIGPTQAVHLQPTANGWQPRNAGWCVFIQADYANVGTSACYGVQSTHDDTKVRGYGWQSSAVLSNNSLPHTCCETNYQLPDLRSPIYVLITDGPMGIYYLPGGSVTRLAISDSMTIYKPTFVSGEPSGSMNSNIYYSNPNSSIVDIPPVDSAYVSCEFFVSNDIEFNVQTTLNTVTYATAMLQTICNMKSVLVTASIVNPNTGDNKFEVGGVTGTVYFTEEDGDQATTTYTSGNVASAITNTSITGRLDVLGNLELTPGNYTVPMIVSLSYD